MGYLYYQKFPYKIMSFRCSAYFPTERLCGYFTFVNYKLVNLSLAEGIFPQKFKKVPVPPPLLIKKSSLPSEDFVELSSGIRVLSGSCHIAHALYQQ